MRSDAHRRSLLGDSSSQVDRRRGGPGPRSCVGTRLGNHDRSAALRLPRRGALRYVRRFGSAASGCRNRTNLAVGQHRRTALPSTTSASGRRRSSRSISPELRVSSDPGASSATASVTAHQGQAVAAAEYLRTQVRVVGGGDARHAGEAGAIPRARRDVRLGKTSESRQQVLEPGKPSSDAVAVANRWPLQLALARQWRAGDSRCSMARPTADLRGGDRPRPGSAEPHMAFRPR